ncbi:MAG: DMT family transporter [Sulfitobacter sp.]
MTQPPASLFADQTAKLSTGAIFLVIAAVFCFSVMDVAVKSVSPKIGTIPVLWARYAGQMLLVIILVAPRLQQVVKSRYIGLQVIRSILLMSATFFFFSGLARISLADASAVMNINPILITLGATVFLGEKLGRRRLIAIAIAVLGAMIIIRPGTSAFVPAALFPLAAAACFASYALMTRHVGPDEDVWTSLFYTGLVGAVIMSIAVPFAWETPDMAAIVQMIIIAGFGTLGQLLLIRAFSQAEAGLLAPFGYLGLVFSVFWGFVIFNDIPGFWTIAGALVIAGAGLYVWHRERQQQ